MNHLDHHTTPTRTINGQCDAVPIHRYRQARSRTWATGASGCAVLVFVASALSQPPQASTFDTSLDGWRSDHDGSIIWTAPEGNPGGYIRFNQNAPAYETIRAPTRFHGDWSDLDRAGVVQYDHKIFTMGAGAFDMVPYWIRLSGPGGVASWTGATPNGATEWTSQTARLVECDWTVQSGTWSSLLSNVTELRIRLEMVANSGGADVTGIDNVFVGPATLCLADFTRDELVNTSDFFAFLAAFFASTPEADMNCDHQVTSQDFFDFLTAFFAGCP